MPQNLLLGISLSVSAHVKQWVSSRSAPSDGTRGCEDMRIRLFQRQAFKTLDFWCSTVLMLADVYYEVVLVFFQMNCCGMTLPSFRIPRPGWN